MPIPADKTDGTAQVTDHAGHHNDLADAVNDHETRLVDVEAAIPTDGTVGQALVVESEGPQVIGWSSMRQVPTGGTNHQVLTKSGSGPWAFDWEDPQLGDQALPPTNSADAGDVVTFNGTSVTWSPAGSGLPGGGTDGEFLGHVAGDPAWVAAPDGLPDSSGASLGDVITLLGPGPGWTAPAVPAMTVSTSDASGTPADGELWIKYTP